MYKRQVNTYKTQCVVCSLRKSTPCARLFCRRRRDRKRFHPPMRGSFTSEARNPSSQAQFRQIPLAQPPPFSLLRFPELVAEPNEDFHPRSCIEHNTNGLGSWVTHLVPLLLSSSAQSPGMCPRNFLPQPLANPTCWYFPSPCSPLLSESISRPNVGLHTTDDSTILLVWQRPSSSPLPPRR